MLHVETYTFGAFAVHNYLLWDDETREALLIDSGDTPTPVIDCVTRECLRLEHLFYTHAHLDHIEGHHAIRAAFPGITAYLNAEDEFWNAQVAEQALAFNLKPPQPARIDVPVKHGDVFHFQNFHLEARHAPGHSPGSICYWVPELPAVFVGDVLFAGTIGRTDFPRGDFDTLIRSIQGQLLTLPDNVTVYSGHGPATTIGQERQHNPYILQALKG